ncbi:MAG: tyrosine--tRNA ligase, partial [Gammaproteobacteria bacterium]
QVAQGGNPRDIKIQLAKEIVDRFHGHKAALQAENDFITRFQKNLMPDEMPEIILHASPEGMSIPQVLKSAGLTPSTSDAIRMIQQNAVKMNGEKIENNNQAIAIGGPYVFQVGKRKFARITIKKKQV